MHRKAAVIFILNDIFTIQGFTPVDYEFIEYENDNKEFKLPLPTIIDSTSEVEKVEGKQN